MPINDLWLLPITVAVASIASVIFTSMVMVTLSTTIGHLPSADLLQVLMLSDWLKKTAGPVIRIVKYIEVELLR